MFKITKPAILLAAIVFTLTTAGTAPAARQTDPLQGSHTLTEDLEIALDLSPVPSDGNAAAIETHTGDSIIGSPGVTVSVDVPDGGRGMFLYGISADGGVVSIDKFYYKGGSGEISRTAHTGIMAANGANISIGDSAEIYAHGSGSAVLARGTGTVVTIGDNAVLYGTKSSNGWATVVAIESAGTTLGAGKISIGDNAYIINDGYKSYDSDYNIAVLAASSQGDAYIKIGNDAQIYAQGNGSNNFAISAGDAHYGTMGTVAAGERAWIATSGDYSYALVSMSTGSDITLGKDASVVTYGTGSHGALAKAGGSIHIGSGSSLLANADIATGLFAVGCSSADFYWPNEDLFGTSAITTGNEVWIETLGEKGYGAVADSRDGYGAEITLGADNNIITHGKEAYGLYSSGSEALIAAGDGLFIQTAGEGAHGVRAQDSGTVETEKATIITQKNSSHGLFVSGNGGASLGEGSTIMTKGESSYGVLVRNGGDVTIGGGSTIITSGSKSYGVYVNNGGKVSMDGATILVDKNSTSYAIAAFNSSGSMDAVIQGDGVFNINGDITAQSQTGDRASEAVVDLTMRDNSLFYGATKLYDDNSRISLSLNGLNTKWNVTGDSQLTNLYMEGATVDMTACDLGAEIFVVNLGQSADDSGVFRMNTNIVDEFADHIYVGGIARGTYTIDVVNDGSQAALGTELTDLVFVDRGQPAVFVLDHIVELGGFQYELSAPDADIVSGRGGLDTRDSHQEGAWYLRGTGQASTPGSGAVNSFAGSYLMAYADTQTLIQRMGDLRQSQYGQGLWFRVHGGKFESNSKGYVRGFDMDYGGVQIGYDRKLENKWDGTLYTGVMFGYGKGDLDYAHEGSGGVDTKTLGIYGTFIANDGWYVDTILKYQWMTNDFDVIDTAGTLVRGKDVDTGGIGASVEIGRRIHVSEGKENKQGWYVEPQAQLSYQRQDGGYFNATNGLRIGVDAFTSLLGRIGMLVGYETDKTNFYAKVSRVKEFDGDLTIHANGVPVCDSFEDNWWVYGIGCTSRINERNSLYLDIERTSGGSFSQPWRVFAGWRVEF